MNNNSKLSIKTKVGFGVGDLGGNLYFSVIGFWLMIFFTDVAGIPSIMAGWVMWIGRVWDAVTDPMMGYVSDNTRTKMGRRRPWMLLGIIPLGISIALLFKTPANSTIWYRFTWALIFYLSANTMYTIVSIPYNSLTPDITKDFDEQTSLNAYRMSFAIVGTLFAALTKDIFQGYSKTPQDGYFSMGIFLGIVVIISFIIPVIAVREKDVSPTVPKGQLLKNYIAALKNAPFRRLLIPWSLYISGISIVMAIFPYFFKYILLDEAGLGPTLLLLLVCALGGIPLYALAAKKWDKHRLYALGMTFLSANLLALALFGDKIPGIVFLILIILGGLGLSSNYVMPYSIIPDTIEYDFAYNGIRREGIYYGLWNFFMKIGQAFALLLVGLVLNLIQYEANVEQTALSMGGIRSLLGPVSVVTILLGSFILRKYPLNRKKYAEVLEMAKKQEEKNHEDF